MVKWWLTLLIAAVLILLAYLGVSSYQFEPPWLKPVTAKISRGDISVPITASGLIQPNQDVEVKPDASGTIKVVNVVEGMFVLQGQVVVEINPKDEERALNRAKAQLESAEAAVARARIAAGLGADVGIATAEAKLEAAAAQLRVTEYEKEKIENSIANYSDREVHNIREQYRMHKAEEAAARIAIESAKLTKQQNEVALVDAEANVKAFRLALGDAEARVEKCTVLAPMEGIVTQVMVKPGMLVQSGTTSITGGAPLLRMADVSLMKVVTKLDEAEYGRVLDISPLTALPDRPGLREAAALDKAALENRSGRVSITIDAFRGRVFEGRIHRVEPQGKQNVGSSVIQFDVHVEITDPDAHLLPLGAQAQVEFTVESVTNTLRVPAEAVKSQGEQKGVFVQVPPQNGEKYGQRFVPCKFGINDGEFTELVKVLDNFELNENTPVYTKLPPKPGENEEHP